MTTMRWPMTAGLALALCCFALTIAAEAQQRPANPLATARSWGYQLQGPKVATLAASPYDVLVIDYSKDGSDDEALTSSDLEKLKKKPDGSRRVVLSYMSIGEAESYRYYWKWTWGGKWYSDLLLGWLFAPSWKGPLNLDWVGNYATRYWQDNCSRSFSATAAISSASRRQVSTASISTRSTRASRTSPKAVPPPRTICARS